MTREFLLSASRDFGAAVDRHKVWFVSSLFVLLPTLAVFFSFVSPALGGKLLGFFCHQNPERSLHLAGMTLPLCARCFGFYTGFGLVGALLPTFSKPFAAVVLTATVGFSILFWFLRFLLPVLDGNLVRLMLGLGLGAGAVLLLKSILKE